ncbi:three component ABC system middle component [Actinomycetes bacterium NPDC127524]
MISSDTFASTNPALCSLILWSFLKGFETVDQKGCELPTLFLPIPLVLSRNIRETFYGTNNSTGLLTWLSREPQVLLNVGQRIEASNSITKAGIIFGTGNKIISFDEHGLLYSNNQGLVQKRLKANKGGEDLKEVFSMSQRFGSWCGQLESTKIIYNVMGLSL